MSDNNLKVLYFTAPWCGPCKIFAPIFEQVSKEYNDVTFEKIVLNLEENVEISKLYNVTAVPTFVVLKNGNVMDKKVGLIKKEAFVNLINKYRG